MPRVGGGVLEHGRGQRPPRPVGLLMLLGEPYAEVLVQERRESHGPLPGELCRDPRVAQAPRVEAVVSVEDAEVVVRVVEDRSEEHTSELQSRPHLVCRLLLEKKKMTYNQM